jgi:WD40 repeat protein
VAAGGSASVVTVWDVAERRIVQTLQGSGHEGCIAFSPDGASLAAGGSDGNVRVWSLADGTQTALFQQQPPRLRPVDVYTVAWSPDGSLLASAGGEGSVIRVWTPGKGAADRPLGGYGSAVHAVVFSRDGAHLFAGFHDGKLRTIPVDFGAPISIVDAHRGGVRALALSPDGKTLASGGVDRLVRLWDVVGGVLRERRALSGHADAVLGVAFSRDGKELATASPDGSVRTWDVDRGAPRQIAFRGGPARGVAYGAGGELAAGLWLTKPQDPNVLIWAATVATQDGR